MAEAKPKPLFFIVLGLVIAALVIYALRGVLFPAGADDPGKGVRITKDDILQAAGIEADDANVPTTVSEYTYVAREKLPPVQQASDYEPLRDRTPCPIPEPPFGGPVAAK